MANTDRNISVIAGTGGSGDCGCCKITELCYDTTDPAYNPCGTESNLRIKALFTEAVPAEGAAGIIITATRFLDPVNPITDVVNIDYTDVLGSSNTLNQDVFLDFANLLSGTKKTLIGTYSITAKKLTQTTFLIDVKGATTSELDFDNLESGKFTVLFKNINTLQDIPKRLALWNDSIYNIVDTPTGFKFEYYLADNSSTAAVSYWLSETAYKFNTRLKNKFFNGTPMRKKVWSNAIANEPQVLRFRRLVEMPAPCTPFERLKTVIVSVVEYPYNTTDTLVEFPIKLTIVDES